MEKVPSLPSPTSSNLVQLVHLVPNLVLQSLHLRRGHGRHDWYRVREGGGGAEMNCEEKLNFCYFTNSTAESQRPGGPGHVHIPLSTHSVPLPSLPFLVSGAAVPVPAGAQLQSHMLRPDSYLTDRNMQPSTAAASHDSEARPFACHACEFSTTADGPARAGPRPGSGIAFLEAVYVRRDPFAPRLRPLVIGADCSMCGKAFCVAPTCSIFYCKRFCLPCADSVRAAFPPEVVRELDGALRQKKEAG